jgi:hypothetical protein
MSKSNTAENDYLKLIYNATAIANIADNAASSPLTNLYAVLHTADPGEAGTATTNECAYTSYARVAIPRNSSGFVVTGNSVSPASTISFPACTGGSETATHMSVTTASSGASTILHKGAISPTIAISSGTTPQITTASTITED